MQKLSISPGVGEVILIILHDWKKKKGRDSAREGKHKNTEQVDATHKLFPCRPYWKSSRVPGRGSALWPPSQLKLHHTHSAPSDWHYTAGLHNMTMVWFHHQSRERGSEEERASEEQREGGEENKSRASFPAVVHRRPVQAEQVFSQARQGEGEGACRITAFWVTTHTHKHIPYNIQCMFLINYKHFHNLCMELHTKDSLRHIRSKLPIFL